MTNEYKDQQRRLAEVLYERHLPAVMPEIEAQLVQLLSDPTKLPKILTVLASNQARAEVEAGLAGRDALNANLLNKKGLIERLVTSISIVQRLGEVIVLGSVDLDRFRRINTKFGHQAGDEVIKEAGKALHEVAARNSDTVVDLRYERDPANPVALRGGGDELGLVLPLTPISVAVKLAEHAQNLFANSMRRRSRDLNDTLFPNRMRSFPTMSIGLSYLDFRIENGDPPSELATRLIIEADDALYLAKLNRGSICVYDPNDPFIIARRQGR